MPCEVLGVVPVDEAGQVFVGDFPPFSALVEMIALAVHFQNMDVVGETVQKCPGSNLMGKFYMMLRGE